MQTDLIKILKLIDLTSLSYTDTSNSIKNLINIGYTPYANVASICIYSQFLADAKQIIDAKNLNYSDINKVKLATVVNFPNGASDIDLTCIETDLAISRGANEIDLVFPYHSLIDGNYNIGAQMINKIKNICQNHAILKVIIESGILPNSQLITDASIISIQNGADFIKTSTGKTSVGATYEAVSLISKAIMQYNKNCGIKVSGGVSSTSIALEYLEIIKNICGTDYINKSLCRLGASSLLNNILIEINNQDSQVIQTIQEKQ